MVIRARAERPVQKQTEALPKRPEKLQKTALFASSNCSTSAQQGCRRSTRSAMGTRTGDVIMLRIRTGARHGLRWGAFGFVAAVFAISSNPTQAAPYADIVLDANTGTVLHSTNPDAQRHPASLTKIMTLYLLFEQLEAGRL